MKLNEELGLLLAVIIILSLFFFPTAVFGSDLVTTSGASHDNNVWWADVYHNSRDAYYRSPGWGTTSGTAKTGAVPVGQAVMLRIRTTANDLTEAKIRYWDGVNAQEGFVSMSVASSTPQYDYWEGLIPSPTQPNDFWYVFHLIDGWDTDYYNDDWDKDGGVGQMWDYHNYPTDYGIVFYDPNFTTPDWHKNAIGYQIFPDRFYNGDPWNDPIGDGTSGDVTWWEWDSDGDGSFTSNDEQRWHVLTKGWGDAPEDPREGRDYFGGDLQGIEQKVGYLSDLGISLVWLNPITEGPDNHGYSVDNYRAIDPYFGVIAGREDGRVINDVEGGLSIFDNMRGSLEDAGIKIVFDTVINHVSAQSLYFQRYENSYVEDFPIGFNVYDPYSIKGAYESPSSPYSSWFEFYEWNHNYNNWWGFNRIPTLKYSQTDQIEQELITGSNSIFTFWDNHGVGGFRLDVSPDYDDGQGSRYINKIIREKVKANNPDAVIIGEVWDRANTWLTGTMNDAVQNMQFKYATIDWIKEYRDDTSYANKLIFAQETYPPEAFYSLWTILGNHDTPRILTDFDGNKDKVMLAATIQFSFPGVPMIYYGDEIGLEGGNDPDNRRTFPWENEDLNMLEYYKKLTTIRRTFPVMRSGSLLILTDDTEGVLVFGRELPGEKHDDAVTIFNRNNNAKTVKIDISSLSGITPGDVLVDVLNENSEYHVAPDLTITVDLAAYGSAILISDLKTTNVKGRFTHGFVINLDEDSYYIEGVSDGQDGAMDIPGHYWIQIGSKRLIGKHYNVGPFGATKWWSSDASDKSLLYFVQGKIDEWSEKKSLYYARHGYVHYRRLIRISDKKPHPSKVLWLRHIAVKFFTLDGGFKTQYAHCVSPGIDYKFIPNYWKHYQP